jgi:crotonobetaine/carnitine-CoA ligase
VAAAEIERVIHTVAGVFEAAVVAEPDEFLGEVPAAFVIPTGERAGLEARILAACTESLADFKVPRTIIFVEAFPRATLNKVLKKDLRSSLTSPMHPSETEKRGAACLFTEKP